MPWTWGSPDTRIPPESICQSKDHSYHLTSNLTYHCATTLTILPILLIIVRPLSPSYQSYLSLCDHSFAILKYFHRCHIFRYDEWTQKLHRFLTREQNIRWIKIEQAHFFSNPLLRERLKIKNKQTNKQQYPQGEVDRPGRAGWPQWWRRGVGRPRGCHFHQNQSRNHPDQVLESPPADPSSATASPRPAPRSPYRALVCWHPHILPIL